MLIVDVRWLLSFSPTFITSSANFGFADLLGHAHKMQAYEVHAYNMQAYETHASNIHAS
jgi:hypothetical protein